MARADWLDLVAVLARADAGAAELIPLWSHVLAVEFGVPGARLEWAAPGGPPPAVPSGHAVVAAAPDRSWVACSEAAGAWAALAETCRSEAARLTEIVADRLARGPSAGEAETGVDPKVLREQRLVAVGALAAEVAHEIRNPLTVMSMLFHNLGLDYPGDDPRSRDIAIIQQKMGDLNAIVERILDLSRAQVPEFKPESINHLAEDVLHLVRLKASQQNVRLVRRYADRLPPAAVDARLVSQAILNLVLNALEAMPDGGELAVRTGLRAAGPEGSESVSVSVEDTGRGLTDDDYRELFRPFLSRRRGGLGLGLTVVQKVVDVHHGGMEVEGEENQGASFRLVFPIRQSNTGA